MMKRDRRGWLRTCKVVGPMQSGRGLSMPNVDRSGVLLSALWFKMDQQVLDLIVLG
jgi:hypothetical protein